VGAVGGVEFLVFPLTWDIAYTTAFCYRTGRDDTTRVLRCEGQVTLCCFALYNSDCWTTTEDVHGWYGTPHNFSRLSKCQATCIADTECVAVDWEPKNAAGKTCWILKYEETGKTMEAGFITHYQLDRACLCKYL